MALERAVGAWAAFVSVGYCLPWLGVELRRLAAVVFCTLLLGDTGRTGAQLPCSMWYSLRWLLGLHYGMPL